MRPVGSHCTSEICDVIDTHKSAGAAVVAATLQHAKIRLEKTLRKGTLPAGWPIAKVLSDNLIVMDLQVQNSAGYKLLA